MATKNGTKVSLDKFYEALIEQNAARETMKGDLLKAMTAGFDGLEKRIGGRIDKQDKEIDCIHTGLDDLRASDKKVGYITGSLAAAFSGIAILVARLMDPSK